MVDFVRVGDDVTFGVGVVGDNFLVFSFSEWVVNFDYLVDDGDEVGLFFFNFDISAADVQEVEVSVDE